MAQIPLTPTVFSSGARDELAAVDTYKTKPGPKPVNSIQAISDSVGFDVSSILGNVNTNMALGAAIKIAGGGELSFNQDVLTQRLLAASSKITSSYRSLSADGKAAMLGNMGMNESLVADINGVKSRVQSANISSLTGLGNFLGDYTGDKNMCKFEDFDAMGGMIGGLVEEGSNLGLEGVWPAITSGISQVPVLTKAAAKALPRLINNGDLSAVFEISGSPAGKAMGSIYPNLGRDLGAAFGLKMSKDTRDKANLFNKYLGTMNNIFGDWDKYDGNGDGFGITLIRMLGSSRSFQDMIMDGVKLFMDDDDPKKNYLLHGLYKETTVEAEVKRFFPRTVIVSQSTPPKIKKSNTVDPRTLMKLGSAASVLIFA